MSEEEKKPIIKEDDPLIRPGKGIAPNKDSLERVASSNEDIDTDPEQAVKEMEEIENSLGEVEKEVKEKTKRVEQSIADAPDDHEELSGPSLAEEGEEIAKVEEIEELDSKKEPETTTSQSPSKPAPKKVNVPQNMDSNTKAEMTRILSEMREKMDEIDTLTKELQDKKKELSKTPPKKTEKLLEEIEVPSLEMLK